MNAGEVEKTPGGHLSPYAHYVQKLGLSEITGWRMRRRGWIETIEIAGRIYVDEREIAAFEERARKGQYKKVKLVGQEARPGASTASRSSDSHRRK